MQSGMLEPEAKSSMLPRPQLRSPKIGPFRLCRINWEARVHDYKPDNSSKFNRSYGYSAKGKSLSLGKTGDSMTLAKMLI